MGLGLGLGLCLGLGLDDYRKVIMYIIIHRNKNNAQWVGESMLTVYDRWDDAVDVAQRLATVNPGWEYAVCSVKSGFTYEPKITTTQY